MTRSHAAGRPSHHGEDPRARLVPNDHLRLLVELLQPAGTELARRWLAALLMVHRHERESVVTAVERRLARLYPLDEFDVSPSRSPRASSSTQAPARKRPGRLSA